MNTYKSTTILFFYYILIKKTLEMNTKQYPTFIHTNKHDEKLTIWKWTLHLNDKLITTKQQQQKIMYFIRCLSKDFIIIKMRMKKQKKEESAVIDFNCRHV